MARVRGVVFAHCDNTGCPSLRVPADDGTIGRSRGHWTRPEQWEEVARGGPAPPCGFCGRPLTRSEGDDRSGQNTACARNTWKTYSVRAGTKATIRQLHSPDPAAVDAVWGEWQPYTMKHDRTWTERVRARPGYWTFAAEQGGRYFEIEFSQLDLQLTR